MESATAAVGGFVTAGSSTWCDSENVRIAEVTGQRPRGFRGPGFACNERLLSALGHLVTAPPVQEGFTVGLQVEPI